MTPWKPCRLPWNSAGLRLSRPGSSPPGPAVLLDRWRLGRRSAALALAGADLWAVLLPTACVVCGSADRSLCRSCERRVRRSCARPYRAEEGAQSLPPAEDAGQAEALLPVLAAGRYAGPLARVILAFKNHGHTDLGAVLGPVLGGVLHQAVRDSGGAGLLLVPVPATRRALRRRGYHPLGLLLGTLRVRGLLPAGAGVAPVLRQAAANQEGGDGGLRGAVRSPGRSQKSLGRKGRRANVHASMTAGPPGSLAGRRCLVVDDVLTTGATVAEAVRALRSAGARVEAAVVIAATSAPSATWPNTDTREAEPSPKPAPRVIGMLGGE